MDAAVYYWDGIAFTYRSYNGGIGGGSQFVPPTQGIFVHATAPATFAVSNAVRAHNGQAFWKNSQNNLLVLSAAGNNYSDEVYVNFNAAATSGFDGAYDAYKLFTYNPSVPQIYSGDLSINVQPSTNVVPVSFVCGTDGTYTISASGMGTFSSQIYLEDKALNTFQDLTQNANYTFAYTTQDNADRFLLHFGPLAVPEVSKTGISIYSYGHDIFVNAGSNAKGTINVYNLLGQIVTSRNINGTTPTQISVTGATAAYVVEVVTNDNVTTQKVFIK
jgi:hypothetical protein